MTSPGDILAVWQLWLVFAVLGALGALLVRRAFLAFRSDRSSPLLLLSTGLLVLILGAPLAWTLTYMASDNMFLCTMTSSLAGVVGALLLLVSTQVRTTH